MNSSLKQSYLTVYSSFIDHLYCVSGYVNYLSDSDELFPPQFAFYTILCLTNLTVHVGVIDKQDRKATVIHHFTSFELNFLFSADSVIDLSPVPPSLVAINRIEMCCEAMTLHSVL